jgi:UTP:GlnB (protein PII) uridylyltransferase
VPLWRTLELSYFARHEAGEIAWHTRSLIDRVDSPTPVVRARVSPFGEGLQVLVYAPDRQDLFARTCGYFDSATSTSSMPRSTRRRAATRSTPSSSSARTSTATTAT